jgi:hypothetical protein
VEPKQSRTGQNEDQQGKKDKSERNKLKHSSNTVKQIKENEKMGKWVELC